MNKFHVYKITNTTTGQVYIGKTSDIKRRFSYHKTAPFSTNESMKNSCPKLYNSIRKYDINNFNFEIIDSFDIEDLALDAEEKYIIQYDSIKNGMNVLVGGARQYSGENSPFYGKHHTEETKHKISEKIKTLVSGENNPMFGKTHTAATKSKISKANKGRIQTPEQLKINSEANKGEKNRSAKINKKIAEQIRDEYKTGNTSSIKLATKYNISKRMILNIIHNKNWI